MSSADQRQHPHPYMDPQPQPSAAADIVYAATQLGYSYLDRYPALDGVSFEIRTGDTYLGQGLPPSQVRALYTTALTTP